MKDCKNCEEVYCDHTSTVTLELWHYNELRQAQDKLNLLLDSLYASASLNWNRTGLAFADELLCFTLKLIDEEVYFNSVEGLKYDADNATEQRTDS